MSSFLLFTSLSTNVYMHEKGNRERLASLNNRKSIVDCYIYVYMFTFALYRVSRWGKKGILNRLGRLIFFLFTASKITDVNVSGVCSLFNVFVIISSVSGWFCLNNVLVMILSYIYTFVILLNICLI